MRNEVSVDRVPTRSTDIQTCPRCGSPAVRIPPAFARLRERREYACTNPNCRIRVYPDEQTQPTTVQVA
jgi:hypothetical protein